MHKSVLLNESIDCLAISAGDVFLDGTLGDGGHSLEVWNRFGESVVIAGIDADSESIKRAKERLESVKAHPKFGVLNFRDIDKAVEKLNIPKPNKILLDLGWSTTQFETSSRGFSFQKDEPLKMTFANEIGEDDITAYDVVNDWEEENLADVIYGFGEEKNSRKIAKAILEAREKGPIKTSKELANLIYEAVPVWYRHKKIHPATKTFQAIRIAVNDELNALNEGIKKAFKLLPPGGRLAIISFHSLEDRIVKNLFKEMMESEEGNLINKKVKTPSPEEEKQNLRSRSAKLRVIEKSKKHYD